MRFPFPPAERVAFPAAVDSEVVSPDYDIPLAELTNETSPQRALFLPRNYFSQNPRSAEGRAEAALEPIAVEAGSRRSRRLKPLLLRSPNKSPSLSCHQFSRSGPGRSAR